MIVFAVYLIIALVIYGFIAYAYEAALDYSTSTPSRWRRAWNVVSMTVQLIAYAMVGMAAIGFGFLLLRWIVR